MVDFTPVTSFPMKKKLQTVCIFCPLSPVNISIMLFSRQSVQHNNNYDHGDEVHVTVVVIFSSDWTVKEGRRGHTELLRVIIRRMEIQSDMDAWWGRGDQHLRTSESPSFASLTLSTSHHMYKSKFTSLKCEVEENGSEGTHLFPSRPGENVMF